MHRDCKTYREAWLDASSPGSAQAPRAPLAPRASDAIEGHAASCEACRLWARRSRLVAGLLGTVTRHAAPADLDRRVARSLAAARSGRGSATPGSALAAALATLERKTAPPVLDRLVVEELVDPEKSNVARQVRRLERRSAPQALAQWIQRATGARDRTRLRRAAAVALVGMAAATVLWLGVAGPRSGPGPRTRVALPSPERVSSPSELARPAEEMVAALAPEVLYGTPVPDGPEGPDVLGAARGEPRIAATAPAEAPARLEEILRGSGGAGFSGLHVVPRPPGPAGARAQERPGADRTGGPRPVSWYASLERVRHAGLRQVELVARTDSGTRLLAFREAILTDGDGGFRIEPFDVLTPVAPDPETFLLVQRARQAFTFRYRDFAVRDPGLFAENYRVDVTGELVEVAGRACRVVHVTHVAGERSFELAVDLQTGVILRDRERDASGELVRSVEYVDFDPDPDLSRSGPRTESREEITTVDAVRELFDGRAWRPRTVPARHYLSSVSLVVGDESGRWIKWTYGDGIEPLFFLQRPAPEGTRSETAEVHLRSFQAGALRAIQGTRGEDEFFAVGDVSEDELLDLIASALP